MSKKSRVRVKKRSSKPSFPAVTPAAEGPNISKGFMAALMLVYAGDYDNAITVLEKLAKELVGEWIEPGEEEE